MSGTFYIRKLGLSKRLTKSLRHQTKLKLKEPNPIQFNTLTQAAKLLPLTDKPNYLYPKSKTFQSVDSIWVEGIEAFTFQMTINEKHNLNKNGLDSVIKAFSQQKLHPFDGSATILAYICVYHA